MFLTQTMWGKWVIIKSRLATFKALRTGESGDDVKPTQTVWTLGAGQTLWDKEVESTSKVCFILHCC
jgi:hypothetical protein